MQRTDIGPLQDAQQAILFVRTHAAEWGIDTGRIGVLGFSAGGHLAAIAGTHYNAPVIPNPAGISLRPSFLLLAYPLITMDTSINGAGVITKLLGNNATPEAIAWYSAERQVTPETPPTFIMQSTDDNLPVKNSLLFYMALIENHVHTEMHLYQGGGHGYGLHNATTSDRWLDRCFNWLSANGWLRTAK